MENKKRHTGRMILFILTIVVIFVSFALRLMEYQVVDAEKYTELAKGGITSTQTIKPARGEILDRYGRPLATNDVYMAVQINQAYLPKDRLNDVIARLIELMEEEGQTWIDNLPISMTEPFTFFDDESSKRTIENLKTARNINMDADATVTLNDLFTSYKLDEMTDKTMARKIAGVRYEMERVGSNRNTPYTFAKTVPTETALKIKEYNFQLPGIEIDERTKRRYTDGDLAPHTVGILGRINEQELEGYNEKIMAELLAANPGKTEDDESIQEQYRELRYIATDDVGKSGIEYAMEEELRGKSGKRQITVDGDGNVIENTTIKEPEPGHTLVLTIDKDLQRAGINGTIDWLDEMRRTSAPGQGREADKAYAVAFQPKTGEVLAIINYPGYNLETYYEDYSELANDPLRPLNNNATRGIYMPGSIFKPSVAIGALCEGIITRDTQYYCGRVYTRFREEDGSGYQPRCLSFHGATDVRLALTVSCNIFFYDAGFNLGIQKMEQYAKQLGLGVETGIEIGEATGHFSSPETYNELRQSQGNFDPWSDGNVVQAAIGQLDNAFSPLQLAQYTGTLANNGKRMKAHLVKSIESYNFNETIEVIEPVLLNEINNDMAFEVVREGMVSASLPPRGSARYYFGTYPVSVASKTGTPQNTGANNNATFIAYAPANDPQIAVAVIIENGYSGQKGAPIAKAIFDEYFRINKTEETQVEQGQLLP